MKLQKITYQNLNARQKENYNFHKIAAALADYGYSCMWLNDDWQGADFIAHHVDGVDFLKVQLKSRLTISRKYEGKDIHIAFRNGDDIYVYPHDELKDTLFALLPRTEARASWRVGGSFSWPKLSEKLKVLLAGYML